MNGIMSKTILASRLVREMRLCRRSRHKMKRYEGKSTHAIFISFPLILNTWFIPILMILIQNISIHILKIYLKYIAYINRIIYLNIFLFVRIGILGKIYVQSLFYFSYLKTSRIWGFVSTLLVKSIFK